MFQKTYEVTLVIGGSQIDSKNIVSGGNYTYTYNSLPEGYKLVYNGSQNIGISGKNITLNNIQQNVEIYLSIEAIPYTITEQGDSNKWGREGFRDSYTIQDNFTITYTLLNPNLYQSSSVMINGVSVPNVNNVYTISIPQGTTGDITITLSATERGQASISTLPQAISNLTYDPQGQNLIIGGVAQNGNIYYVVTDNSVTIAPSKESSSWNTNIPKGTNAGTYKVWYYAKGNSGYDDSNINYVEVTISKANLSSLSVSMDGWTVGQNASEPQISGNTGGGTVTYKYKLSTASDSAYSTIKPSTAGTYTVQAIVEATENYNGKSVTSNFTITNPTIVPKQHLVM